MPWLMSTRRASGRISRITPFMTPTKWSERPKSVVSVMMGLEPGRGTVSTYTLAAGGRGLHREFHGGQNAAARNHRQRRVARFGPERHLRVDLRRTYVAYGRRHAVHEHGSEFQN